MIYLLLSVVLTAIFGVVAYQKEAKAFSFASTVVAFVIFLIVSFGALPVFNLWSFTGIWWLLLISSGLGLFAYFFSFIDDYQADFNWWRITPLCVVFVTFSGLGLRGCEYFQPEKFCNMMPVDTVSLAEFKKDLFPTTVKKMICVDEAIATKIAEELLDSDPGLGSRVAVGNMTMQPISGNFAINNDSVLSFDDAIIWVAPLEHKSFFKWISNDVTPGYVIVDATDASLTRRWIVTELNGKPLALRYVESGRLWEDIEFHIKMNGYISRGLTDHRFEIDNHGNPHWVLTSYEPQIGFSAAESKCAITVDPQTGEIEEYLISEAPEWLDRMQPENFVYEQISWWGEYQEGWWNSWVSQRNVQSPTPGMTLVYSDSKSYWYTGIQSSGNSESSSGFMLVNTRDKSARYYKMNGVNERQAQSIAEDIPFAKTSGYMATKPVLYNLRGIPSYFMILKGTSGNAMGYAFVSVENRSLFGAGTTPEEAEQAYLSRIGISGDIKAEDDGVEKVSGKYSIKDITLVGETFYILFNGLPNYEFRAPNSLSPELKWTKPHHNVNVTYGKGENKFIPLLQFDNLDINF